MTTDQIDKMIEQWAEGSPIGVTYFSRGGLESLRNLVRVAIEAGRETAPNAVEIETIKAASGIIQNVSPIGGSNHAPTQMTFKMAHEFMASHLAAAIRNRKEARGT